MAKYLAVLIMSFLACFGTAQASEALLVPDMLEDLVPVMLQYADESSDNASENPTEEEERLIQEQEYEENTSDESSVAPHIPEPMVFDLIRPLGARKGEFEINTLGLWPLRNRNLELEWAPEVEYAFRDGHAIELEVPFRDHGLNSFKFAYQATLPKQAKRPYIHGIQAIARHDFSPRRTAMESTYLFGYAMNDRLSVMTITGARANVHSRGTNMDVLINPSLFYHVNKRVTLGVESNLRLRNTRNYDFNLIPQMFIEFGKYASLQVGAGLTRQQTGTYRPLLAMRIIMAFR